MEEEEERCKECVGVVGRNWWREGKYEGRWKEREGDVRSVWEVAGRN